MSSLYCIFIYRIYLCNIIIFSFKKLTDLIIKGFINSLKKIFCEYQAPPPTTLAKKNKLDYQNQKINWLSKT
jgi:hypothetical protein